MRDARYYTICNGSDLDDAARRRVVQMLYGDGTCTPSNVQLSCFASEHCNCEHPFVPSNFPVAPHMYVAMHDDAPVGIVTMIPMNMCGFLGRNIVTRYPGYLMSTLCVHSAFQNVGVGRALIAHALGSFANCGENLYTSVRLPDARAEADVVRFMEERSARLLGTYERAAFARVCSTPDFTIMRLQDLERYRKKKVTLDE